MVQNRGQSGSRLHRDGRPFFHLSAIRWSAGLEEVGQRISRDPFEIPRDLSSEKVGGRWAALLFVLRSMFGKEVMHR